MTTTTTTTAAPAPYSTASSAAASRTHRSRRARPTPRPPTSHDPHRPGLPLDGRRGAGAPRVGALRRGRAHGTRRRHPLADRGGRGRTSRASTRQRAEPRPTATRRPAVPASPLLRRAVAAALWAADYSDGLVDATLLGELELAGYTGHWEAAERADVDVALASAPARRPAAPAAWRVRDRLRARRRRRRRAGGGRAARPGRAREGIAADLAPRRSPPGVATPSGAAATSRLAASGRGTSRVAASGTRVRSIGCRSAPAASRRRASTRASGGRPDGRQPTTSSTPRPAARPGPASWR